MWITEKKNGKGTRYTYRERFQDKRTGKDFICSVTLNSKSAHAKKMAVQMLNEKAAEKEAASPQSQKEKRLESLTLATVAAEWKEHADLSVKDVTKQLHGRFMQRILKETPPGLLFQDFTPAMAEKIMHTLYYSRKLSWNYSGMLLITLKAILRYAKKAGYIENVSDFECIKLKRRPATPDELKKQDNKFLTQEELADCLQQISRINKRVALAMEFMALTGLRCGELLALRRQDVNLEKRQLSVTGTLRLSLRNGDPAKRGTPKNAYSYRTIDLNKRSVQILKWFYTDNRRMEKWSRTGNSLCSNYKDRGYIFTTRTGEPLRGSSIERTLQRVNIPGKHITTHIFRHTHISMLVAMGVPLKAIMKRVGHNNPNTTLAIYTHLTPEMKEQELKALDQISL